MRRRRRTATSGDSGAAASVSVIVCSVKTTPASLELRCDELLDVDLLPDLLVLVHQLCVGGRALQECIVELPDEFDVRYGEFDRLLLLAELCDRHVDDLRRMRHRVLDRLA